MKKFCISLSAFALLFMIAFTPSYLAFAQQGGNSNPNPQGSNQNDPAQGSNSNTFTPLKNPFSGGDNLMDLLKTIIDNILLPIGGVIAVLAFIYSGFLYVVAQGNESKIQKAHQALFYSAIGTAILLGAWVIANVIGDTIKQLQ